MNLALLLAGVVALAVALVHSLLGEREIFRALRAGTVVPTLGRPVLRERHVRILWATWHLASVLGAAIGVVLLRLAAGAPIDALQAFTLNALAAGMAGGAALVAFATRARHPGWVGLLAVAVLVALR